MSTTDQDVAGQVDELEAAGCVRIYDTASGSLRSRPELDKALGALRAGDVLVVVRLDRLGRSLRHLIETVQQLTDRGVGLGRSGSRSTRRPRPGGWCCTSSGRWRSSSGS